MKQKYLIIIIFCFFSSLTKVSAQDSCNDYCRDRVYFSGGTFNARTGSCDYSSPRTCEYGCDSRGIVCVSAPIATPTPRPTSTPTPPLSPSSAPGASLPANLPDNPPANIRDCIDYCSDKTRYYQGIYNSRINNCEYQAARCEYGCDKEQKRCQERPEEREVLEKEGEVRLIKRESFIQEIILPKGSDTGKLKVSAGGQINEIRIKNTKNTNAEITDDNHILIKNKGKEFKVKPNFERLIYKYVRKNETVKELKIDVKNNRPVYQIEKSKRVTLLWRFTVNLRIETLVDAEDLRLIKEKKPLWKFLITKGDEVVAPKCGDKNCDKDEGSEICPEDCGSLCGNGICELANHLSCPWDCPENCGNENCGTDENLNNCPEDCGTGCGNGKCEGNETGETKMPDSNFKKGDYVFCPQDCGYCGDSVCGAEEFDLNDFHSYCIDCQPGCGNGFCEPGESPIICPYDCDSTACGNGNCEWNESPTICPEDCSHACGNGTCEKGESPSVCVADCSACGDDVCSGVELTLGYCSKDCKTACGNNKCEGGESVSNCPVDCLKCKDCVCGDGKCEENENSYNCPGDCEKTCGDNICSLFESILSCPQDCKNSCGDGICDGKDLKDNCQVDCSITSCGDGICSILETAKVCPQDCKKTKIVYPNENLYKKDPAGFCGDNICKGTETMINCQVDCKGPCGNGICNAGENSDNCMLDCSLLCGNGTCDKGENWNICPIDCGYCGDNVCALEKEKYCPTDCGVGLVCGNGKCGPGENPENCPPDCQPPLCGNGLCETTENPAKCPVDCANVCGDNICNKGESYLKCPWDCSYCGDGVCGAGEENCSFDCLSVCGNGICEKDESCQSCPYDCTGV